MASGMYDQWDYHMEQLRKAQSEVGMFCDKHLCARNKHTMWHRRRDNEDCFAMEYAIRYRKIICRDCGVDEKRME